VSSAQPQNGQQRRAELRRILRFLRAANRLREIGTQHSFEVKLKWSPNPVVVTAPDWTIVENLLVKFRPLYLDKEECSFRQIVRILPKHFEITSGRTYADIERRWDEILQSRTAPVPIGSEMESGGYRVVAGVEGVQAIIFDSVPLTGREALELSLYGELVHVDASKERRRLQIRASRIEPAYQCALLGVLTACLQEIDELRHYAQMFVDEFPPELVRRIEDNPTW
jgi:hypothetical protein